ncbi:MAG TPA: hypothetical protein VFV38_32580 [Ktedonobacteraceae bacterium]|nr:hypothetical protein [Ktedonobacteraceae bacterium]
MEVAEKKTITVYHGTTIEDAEKILSAIDASKGSGEFGAGLYTVFSLPQALHIAQYYWDAEQKYLKGKTGIAVVAIDIALKDWEEWVRQGEVLCYQTEVALPGIPLPTEMQAWSVEEYANGDDKGRDRGWAIIIGPIKDRATPYLQAVFGSQAQKGLKRAKRAVVSSQKAQKAIGRGEYSGAEAREGMGTLNQTLSANDVLSTFMARAAEFTGQGERSKFVTQVFGGFNAEDLPGGKEGRALIKFLKERGLETTETTPDGVIYDYIRKGLPN